FNPIIKFNSYESKNDFLSNHKLTNKPNLWKNFVFNYQSTNEIDLREIYFRFIQTRYENLLNMN
ncbi:hypothetical protein, partial [Mycoplasmopsis felis]|uniref:hypothetical protein n=1 Tax=Mycoplasmopsis felis TaxID=33923 RepID=UPI00055FE1E9